MVESETPNFLDFGGFFDIISKSLFLKTLLENRAVIFEKYTVLQQKKM